MVIKDLNHGVLNGKYHRIDGPAKTEWYENGNKKSEEWYLYDKLHRIDGMAYIEWGENGNKKIEKWYKNGNLQYVSKRKRRCVK